ncbi:MAG: hypothetical protein F6K47_15785 [Symploca sp. SIO2E6]|nr:hypothetical protein [Symploca sp. SIO2E6]
MKKFLNAIGVEHRILPVGDRLEACSTGDDRDLRSAIAFLVMAAITSVCCFG